MYVVLNALSIVSTNEIASCIENEGVSGIRRYYTLRSIEFSCNILHRSFDYCLKNRLRIVFIINHFCTCVKCVQANLCTLIIGSYRMLMLYLLSVLVKI